MGYYANAALERSYRERSCCGYLSRGYIREVVIDIGRSALSSN